MTEAPAGDTRARLLAAAETLIEERGPSGVGLREVARRVGVSHGAPQRHFPSLATLLTAVAVDGFLELFDAVATATDGAGGDPRLRLAAAGRSYVACATARPGRFALMFRFDLLVPGDPALTTSSGAAFEQLVDAVRDAQSGGWNADEPPVLLAGALWSGVHGLALLWSQGALPTATANRDLATQLAVFFRALGLHPTKGPTR